MAQDLLLGKTTRDWSCGKSAAELWDEAESQRLHRPVHVMAPRHAKAKKIPELLMEPNSDEQSKTPWGWIFGIGAAVAGVGLAITSVSTHQKTRV